MRPPMWPPTEMTLDSPKVSSRLMTSTPRTGLLRMLMPRLRPRASTAPIRPKMAPEAPTVRASGEMISAPRDPPSRDTKYTTASGTRPTDFSISPPRIQSAYMLNARWMKP